MIYIDDNDPEEELDPSFSPRNVAIKWNTNPNDFLEMTEEIGRGKFGTVFKCKENSTNLHLAVKFVTMPKREDRRNAEREVEIMNSLKHNLIIQLYAAYEFGKTMYLVQELIEGGELFDRVIDDEFVLTEKVCTVFVRQICEGMQFIHSNNILHLDLKPENILCLTKEGNRIKIIDFGLARKYDPDKKLQVLFGTPEFVAPEVVNFDNISYATDMWSVGVICYVLISGLSPFMGETDLETMANVTIAKYDFDDEAFNGISEDALDFISKLLVKDLSIRMTASQCLDHKWLKRKQKPPLSPKPTHLPPPKVRCRSTLSPSPIIFDFESETKGMDHTKDNLKTFIERWEEHPNSPYIFDSELNLIEPIRDIKANSINSSRACSPSPCESIESNYADENIKDIPMDDNGVVESSKLLLKPPVITLSEEIDTPETCKAITNESDQNEISFQNYLQSFDRRNSDTSYLMGKQSIGERINLADEIRKLSDHLLMLAEINTKLEDDNARLNNNLEPESTVQNHHKDDVNNTRTTSKTKESNPNQPRLNTLTGVSQANSDKLNSIIGIKNKPLSEPASISRLSMRLQNQILSNDTWNESDNSIKTIRLPSFTNIKTSTTSTTETVCSFNGYNKKQVSSVKETINTTTSDQKNIRTIVNNNLFSNFPVNTKSPNVSLGVPWTVKRTKFRINQSSRDVPIGSPNTHQTVNLEEAATNTKDCLLHLLEKYNETKLRSGPGGRHQSISVDWNVSQNLEYTTMNSINTFFQRHASSSRNVKQTIDQIESKNKN